MEKSSSPSSPLLSPPPPPIYGIPVPSDSTYHSPPAYILLPVYPRRRRRPCRCCSALLSSSSLLALAALLLLVAASSFFLYPSDPTISIARIDLSRFRISSPPSSLSISLGLDLVVRNPDFFSLDYNSIDVAVGYRGRRLGSVKAGGGRIRARGVSYVEAELRVDGVRMIDDMFYLIEDLARGSVPFDTVTEIQGRLHLFFVDAPIQVLILPNSETLFCFLPPTGVLRARSEGGWAVGFAHKSFPHHRPLAIHRGDSRVQCM